MRTDKVVISVGEGKEVSGVLSIPTGPVKKGLILAHGAGNDMHQPMLVFLAEGLAQAGYLTLRFNFLYKEQGKNWNRDQLCDLELLRGVLSRLTVPWDLEVIEGGDHSFNVPKSIGAAPHEIYGRILDNALAWLGE